MSILVQMSIIKLLVKLFENCLQKQFKPKQWHIFCVFFNLPQP